MSELSYPAINEQRRLAALQEYGIEEALADPGLDRIVQLAANLFRVPVVLVSLVEDARQLFASSFGTDLCETDRSSSFCAYALGSVDCLIVPDSHLDPRFVDNPLVTGPPGIRFYAGCPLVAPGGHVLGTLCLIDVVPRPALNDDEISYLRALAALVMDKLELRRLDLAWRGEQTRFERMAEVSPDAIVCLNRRGRVTFWNPAAERLLGYSSQDMLGRTVSRIVPRHTLRILLGVAEDDASRLVGRTAEIEITSASGTRIPVEVSASAWRDSSGMSFCAVVRDVTERRRNEARLYRLAHLDALTDLPNRTLFRTRVEEALGSPSECCLLMVDLDGFKEVNDGFGHAAGDAMLVAVAKRLRETLRPVDTVARMGGDEFAVFMPGINTRDAASRIANDIIEVLSQPVWLEGEPVSIGASVGIALSPQDGVTVGDLLSGADLALYEAKANGKHCSRFCSVRLREAAAARQAYQTEFSRAVENNEWEIFYQPLVRLADDVIVGAEALLYWRHPAHGVLPPSVFMGALQSSPLAARIGHWMLNQACEQLARWRVSMPDLRISVNVLDAQFRAGDLTQRMQSCLARTGLAATAVELEITENIMLRTDAQTSATLLELRALGVSIAFSNYGTGHGSLDLLKRVPLTRLKIDASFVRAMLDSTADAAIIRAILYLGRSLELNVSAEGVDTQMQCLRLRRKGCEEAQGGWFGGPVAADRFMARLSVNSAAQAED